VDRLRAFHGASRTQRIKEHQMIATKLTALAANRHAWIAAGALRKKQ
jgi:hypothetical protein